MSDEAIARLTTFFGRRNGGAGSVTIHDYTPITGGYSRAMSRFWVEDTNGRRGYVMRADPPPGQSILDTDRTYEWELLQALDQHGSVRLPKPLWFDPTGEELGSPAFISENLECDSLHVLTQRGTPESNRQYTAQLAEAIASVHNFPIDRLPAGVRRPTSWSAYLDECIASWRSAEAAHAEHEPFLRVVAAWLDAHRPPETPLRLVHGDFQGPNVLVQHGTGTYHMIDWELAHIGDPREDLGWWVLAHMSMPPDAIENDKDSFLARYRELTGLSEEVVNPATIAYFTVQSSAGVFFNLIKMTARIAHGETMGSSVAYMTNAMPFMHATWITSMRLAGHWTKENAS